MVHVQNNVLILAFKLPSQKCCPKINIDYDEGDKKDWGKICTFFLHFH